MIAKNKKRFKVTLSANEERILETLAEALQLNSKAQVINYAIKFIWSNQNIQKKVIENINNKTKLRREQFTEEQITELKRLSKIWLKH